MNVDAEDHTTTDSTLRIVGELRREFPSVATVLQAYLHRTEDDCRALAGAGSRIRLCKGAYREPAEVAFQGKEAVDASYLRCLRILMEGQGYPMVASHDPQMISAAQAYAAETGRGTDDFEIQMLYGIRDSEQTRLVDDGRARAHLHPVRERLVRLLHATAGRAPRQPGVLPARPRRTAVAASQHSLEQRCVDTDHRAVNDGAVRAGCRSGPVDYR